MKSAYWKILSAIAFLLFCGCSSSSRPQTQPLNAEDFQVHRLDSLNLRKNPPKVLLELPLVRQGHDYTCGVACAMSVLRYAGYEFDVREDRMAATLGSTETNGTDCRRIEQFLNKIRRRGSTQPIFCAEIKTGLSIPELCRFLDQGKPVICLIQAWSDHPEEYRHSSECGHYVIAIGYDAENIYFMDPSTSGNYAFIPQTEFLTRWHDGDERKSYPQFGMVISLTPAYDKNMVFKLE